MTDFLERHYRLIFYLLLGAIVILSFYVGMLEGERAGGKSPVVLSCTEEVLSALRIPGSVVKGGIAKEMISATAPTTTGGRFAGSKNGTKYYTPGCAGLDRIKPENIIWFKDAQDATLQGYTAAAC